MVLLLSGKASDCKSDMTVFDSQKYLQEMTIASLFYMSRSVNNLLSAIICGRMYESMPTQLYIREWPSGKAMGFDPMSGSSNLSSRTKSFLGLVSLHVLGS